MNGCPDRKMNINEGRGNRRKEKKRGKRSMEEEKGKRRKEKKRKEKKIREEKKRVVVCFLSTGPVKESSSVD